MPRQARYRSAFVLPLIQLTISVEMLARVKIMLGGIGSATVIIFGIGLCPTLISIFQSCIFFLSAKYSLSFSGYRICS